MNGLRVSVAFRSSFRPSTPPTSIPLLARLHGVTQATAGTVFHQAYLAAQRELMVTSIRFSPNVRTFPGGGAPKPPQLHHEIRQEMGAPIVSGYGLTECPVLAMNGPSETRTRKLANTEGRACPPEVEIRVVTLEGRGLPGLEEEGEIRVKAPAAVPGILGFITGCRRLSIARGSSVRGTSGISMNEGYIVVTGRLKDVIIRKGENISAPRSGRPLCIGIHSVSDVAVIGHPRYAERGERCCAVVASGHPAPAPLEFRRDGSISQSRGTDAAENTRSSSSHFPNSPATPPGRS